MVERTLKARLVAEDRASKTIGGVSQSLKTLGAVAAAVGVFQIGKQLVRGIGAAIDASAKQQLAEQQLASALRQTGQSASQILPDLKKHASALQDITGVGDEVILSGQVLLTTLGKLRGEGLQRATKAAIDMAAITGSISTGFDLVSKAASGYTSTLSRYGIILDKNIPESEKFAAALEKIEELFAGQAQAKLNTYIGRLEELKGRFGDLREVIGGPFREVLEITFRDLLSPAVKDLTDAAGQTDVLRNAVFDLAIEVNKMSVELLKWLNTFDKAFSESSIGQLFSYVQAFNAVDQAVADVVTNPLIDFLKSAAVETAGATDQFLRMLGVLNSTGPVVGPFTEGLLGTNEALEQGNVIIDAAIERFERYGEALELAKKRGPLPLPPLPPNFKELQEPEEIEAPTLEPVEESTIEATRRLGEAWGSVLDPFKAFADGLPELPEKIKRIDIVAQELGNTLKNQVTDAALQMGDTLVAAAFGAKVAWGDFLRDLIQQMIAAIIKMLILQAIAVAIKFVGTAIGGAVGGPAGAAGGAAAGGAAAGIVAQGAGGIALTNAGSSSLGDIANTSQPVVVNVNAEGAAFLDAGMPARLARQIANGLRTNNEAGLARGAA